MNHKIQEEVLNEIRNKNDIVDVISEFVQLKKQGRNYFGLCPFHGENTPSFSVAPDKQIFHCFGCGAGGNVFTFLMDIEGVTFTEAVKRLADKANIPIQLDISEGESNHTDSVPKEMMDAHELLSKFYHHLLVNTKQGQEALEYCLDRGLTRESIDRFQIGYAANSWDLAYTFLKRRGFSIPSMVQAGLLVQRERDDQIFDRFRNRIMFPIFDRQGKPIAFSGRALGGDEPKYLNSPETPLFHKSKVLYNYQFARPAIRKRGFAVLFEGFADCISADRAGITNGVATMGTALTEEHLQLLRRTTSEILICYDSDSAGLEAANKASDVIHLSGCSVKIALMPDGYDPDDYIKKFGASKFQTDVIGAAHTFLSFKMIYHRRGKNFANEGEKMDYIEKILFETTKLENEVESEYYLRQLATEFSLSPESLIRQQRKVSRKVRSGQPVHESTKKLEERFLKDTRLKPAFHKAEEVLIKFMLQDRDLAYRIQHMLGEEQLNLDDHQAIVTYIYAFYEEGNMADSSLFLNFLPDKKLQKLVTEIEMMTIHSEPSEKELQDYIHQVLKYRKMLLVKEKRAKAIEAVRKQDHQLAAKIEMEIIQLLKSM